MKVIIIEDEKPAARRLNRLLTAYDVDVITLLHSVEDSKKWLTNNEHPDVIFLDIQLSDGISFEIFEDIETTSAIIFTTAYDEYALQAFKLKSIDYLLKPIDKEDLDRAIKKYRDFQPSEEVNFSFQDIKKLLNPVSSSYKERFSVKVGQHIKLITVEEVTCFYSENKATYIHTKEGRNYILEHTLEELEQFLNPKLFFRINRQCFVNINAIKDIISYTNSRLQVKLHHFNAHELIVSRERVKDFKIWIS